MEHHLISCKLSKSLWKKEEWIFQNLEVKFPLTECEILFGIPDNNDNILKIVNFLTLFSKWLI